MISTLIQGSRADSVIERNQVCRQNESSAATPATATTFSRNSSTVRVVIAESSTGANATWNSAWNKDGANRQRRGEALKSDNWGLAHYIAPLLD
jgi:hypothetical protein